MQDQSVMTGPENDAVVGGHIGDIVIDSGNIRGTYGKAGFGGWVSGIWDLASAGVIALHQILNPKEVAVPILGIPHLGTGRQMRFSDSGQPIFHTLTTPRQMQGACVNGGMPGIPRTLIADDQSDVLEALRLLLKNEGFQIEAVNSPAAVIEKLKSQPYDLLLMDLNYTRDTTSGQEGLDLLARIQDIDKTLPVVGMTAWGSVDLAVEAMQHGMRDFVLKPWENAKLLRTLRDQIEQGQRQRNELRQEREEFEEARAIGLALLPKNIPEIPGLDIATTTEAVRSLSGDYFDVVELGEGRLGICIADVIGKGVPAALLMSNVQATVRALAAESLGPGELVGKLNRSVCRNTTAGKFVTSVTAKWI